MSQFISVFDMLKIGVGPSSSHTLGPWRAAQQWITHLKNTQLFEVVTDVKIDLYGSLSLTGKGHATDLAVLLGLSGTDPEYIPVENIESIINSIKTDKKLNFNDEQLINFSINNVIFNKDFLPFHSNGLTFRGYNNKNKEISTETYYSIGGGFVIQEDTTKDKEIEITQNNFPYPINRAIELEHFCENDQKIISEIVLENELILKSEDEINHEIKRIWDTMLECIDRKSVV